MRTSVVVVIGNILLFSSCLNRGSGSPRRSDASTASIASSCGMGSPTRPSTAESTIASSRSIRFWSAIGHPRPQRLQASPLKLFDRSLAPPQLPRHLADALLLREPHDDHAPLIGRQPVDGAKELRAPLD